MDPVGPFLELWLDDVILAKSRNILELMSLVATREATMVLTIGLYPRAFVVATIVTDGNVYTVRKEE